MARTKPKPISAEVSALVILAAGLVLLLAMISYTGADLPSWFPYGKGGRTVRAGANYIGPFGAMLAFLWYSLLGVAAYLLAAVLIGWGGAKLVSPKLRVQRRWIAVVAALLTAAGVAHLLGQHGWGLLGAKRLALPGEGGLLGGWIGTGIGSIFGSIGGVFVLALLYLGSVLLLAGISPVAVMRQIAALPRMLTTRFHAWQELRAERAKEQAALDAREAKRRSSQLKEAAASERRRKKETPAVDEADEEESSPFTEPAAPASAHPAPKIFDGTAPPAPRARKEKQDNTPMLTNFSCEGYELPSLDLLDALDPSDRQAIDPAELHGIQGTIVETLEQFGISVAPGDITRGPTITRYEVYPAKGVRVDRISALERDIARATRAERINILAPIPGKDTVGIEIANSKKQKVALRELLESDDFHSSKCRIPIALGKDVYGKVIVGDLAAMPHGLVAGTTGSGKSVCVNAIIASILYRFTPEDLRFIMIDPKVVEMQIYNSLPHLAVPVVTDPKKVLVALKWAVDEMEKRYAIFAKVGVRNIAGFNARPKPKSQRELDEEREKAEEAAAIAEAQEARPDELPLIEPRAAAPAEAVAGAEPAIIEAPVDPSAELADPAAAAPVAEPDPETLTSEERITNMTKLRNSRETDLIVPDSMPYLVIIVDELADLMQTAPADMESLIARITQKARAAGIHMIIATQTPRADVITGVIKANVPSRIAFQVASALDSRVILDENGAERLLGQGDMMYRPPGTSRLIRAQGVLVTDEEIHRVVDFVGKQGEPAFETSMQERLENDDLGEEEEVSEEDEELVEKCYEVMRQEKKASTSLFQRRLRLGYTRAARILDIMEARGYVGPGEGAKPREILVNLENEADVL